MSMIFQSYALWPNMTVEQNVAFGLKMRKVAKDEARRRVGADPRRGAARPSRRALSQRTLRRPAAAGVAGPRAGGAAGNPAARRAAVESRRQSARGDAQRDPPPAQRIRHHLDLRHPRPVRGDDDVGPHRRHEQGPHRADRRSPDALYQAEDALCRRVHRPLQHSRRQAQRLERRLQRFRSCFGTARLQRTDQDKRILAALAERRAACRLPGRRRRDPARQHHRARLPRRDLGLRVPRRQPATSSCA